MDPCGQVENFRRVSPPSLHPHHPISSAPSPQVVGKEQFTRGVLRAKEVALEKSAYDLQQARTSTGRQGTDGEEEEEEEEEGSPLETDSAGTAVEVINKLGSSIGDRELWHKTLGDKYLKMADFCCDRLLVTTVAYPNHSTLHCTALHCTALHDHKPLYTALLYTVLHCTALHHHKPLHTALHCTALHHPRPLHTTLHRTALHCTTLHHPKSPYTRTHSQTFPRHLGFWTCVPSTDTPPVSRGYSCRGPVSLGTRCRQALFVPRRPTTRAKLQAQQSRLSALEAGVYDQIAACMMKYESAWQVHCHSLYGG